MVAELTVAAVIKTTKTKAVLVATTIIAEDILHICIRVVYVHIQVVDQPLIQVHRKLYMQQVLRQRMCQAK